MMHKNLTFYSPLLLCVSFFLLSSLNAQEHVHVIGSTRLVLISEGTICDQPVEAIVNASIPQLNGGDGSGIDRIIQAQAGPDLSNACMAFETRKKELGKKIRCSVGQAKITESYELNKKGIKKIIHAVGPSDEDCDPDNPLAEHTLLASAYTASLQTALDNNLTSIAFPTLRANTYDIHQTAPVILKAIIEFVQSHPDKLVEIRIVCHDRKNPSTNKSFFDEYKDALVAINNPPQSDPLPPTISQQKTLLKPFLVFSACTLTIGGICFYIYHYKKHAIARFLRQKNLLKKRK